MPRLLHGLRVGGTARRVQRPRTRLAESVFAVRRDSTDLWRRRGPAHVLARPGAAPVRLAQAKGRKASPSALPFHRHIYDQASRGGTICSHVVGVVTTAPGSLPGAFLLGICAARAEGCWYTMVWRHARRGAEIAARTFTSRPLLGFTIRPQNMLTSFRRLMVVRLLHHRLDHRVAALPGPIGMLPRGDLHGERAAGVPQQHPRLATGEQYPRSHAQPRYLQGATSLT